MKSLIRIATLFAVLATASPVWAAVPQLINFQGILTTAGGSPVANGSYSVTFRIYNLPTGGTPLWTETQTVSTTGGLFTATLGSNNPIPDSTFNDSGLFLGIAVAPDGEMSPRQQLVTVAYAQRVGSVFGAAGGLSVEFGDSTDTLTSLGHDGEAKLDQVCSPPPTPPGVCFPFVVTTVGTPGNPPGMRAGAIRVLDCFGGTSIRGNGWNGDFSARGKATFGPAQFNGGFYSFLAGSSHVIPNGVNQATIPGGFCNTATAHYATVGGGDNNNATAVEATIGGGGSNNAGGFASTISGGARNTINPTGRFDVIGGGSDNVTSPTGTGHQTIGGGERNSISSGVHNTIAGGLQNAVINNVNANAIGGGWQNTIFNHWSVIGGGNLNTVNGRYAVIGGGQSDTADGWWSVIGGGLTNFAAGNYSTISGGQSCVTSADHTTVGGGQRNNATAQWATVGGGQDHKAVAQWATIPGGQRNTASGNYSTVGGGQGNAATGSNATTGGGGINVTSGNYATTSGGQSNMATGDWATIPGGMMNVASAPNSFAAGTNARAVDTCSFVWSDCCIIPGSLVSPPFFSNGNNTFNARATGGVFFITSCDSTVSAAGTTSGVVLPGGGSAWSSVSDSTMKQNIRPVDGAEILAKLAELPVKRWSYKAQDAKIEHIGPMAQDFYRIFGLGEDDRRISTLDPDGIALAAIKELHARNEEQKAEIEFLKGQLAQQAEVAGSLQAQLSQLQATVTAILAAQERSGDLKLASATATGR